MFALIAFIHSMYSCTTKEITFYDIDKTHLIYNRNKIYDDSTLSCYAEFGVYSNADSPLKYSGIWINLSLKRDSGLNIEQTEMIISPSINHRLIKPESFMAINAYLQETLNGNKFNAVKPLVNKLGTNELTIYFEDNVKQYDSLYLNFYIKYSINGKYFEIRKKNVYIKSFFREQITR